MSTVLPSGVTARRIKKKAGFWSFNTSKELEFLTKGLCFIFTRSRSGRDVEPGFTFTTPQMSAWPS